MKTTRYQSVWDAISDTPQEAASMKARSKLMMELSEIINTRKLRQKDAAELFGVTQPRISDLTRGKIHLFSLDMLMDMASTAGMSPEVVVTKPRIKRVIARSSTSSSRRATLVALAA
jgi:predicted XRE-type DNA-binding protein